MRAHLVMNPEARGVTPAMQRVVQAALEGRFKLEVTQTHARDSAVSVTAEAVQAGAEMIIAFGGDGLVNEVVNGAAGTEATVAIIPGGTMNVFARNLGIEKDPVAATDRILRRAGKESPRRITLGAAGGRLFAFACGCGFDAETAEKVEGRKSIKKRFGEPYFYASAMVTFVTSYFLKEPFLKCEGAFGAEDGVLAIALNAENYAYLLGRPVRFAPQPPDEGKLSFFILRKMRYSHLIQYGLGALVTARYGAESKSFTNLERLSISGLQGNAFAVHVDGEPRPAVESLEVRGSAGFVNVLV